MTERPLHIAYLSPLPPARSGVSDYSQALLPHLAQQMQITLFTQAPEHVDETLTTQFPVFALADYPERRWLYDFPLYHLGNSVAHHDQIYRLFTRYPGIVVLHDFVLHGFHRHRTVGQDNWPDYTQELGYALGQRGINQAWQMRAGDYTPPHNEYPLVDRILTLCLGLIVHNQYAARQISQAPCPVRVIPALMESRSGQSLRRELNWPSDAVIFSSVGHVTAHKQIDFALQAFRRVREQLPQAHYLLVGQVEPYVNLEEIIAGLDLTEFVKIVDYVPSLQRFVDWIHTADVVVNLRYPTIGETSAAALRAMAAGRPVIVFDHGWYSELPDAACVKTPPMDSEALVAAMLSLADDAALRRRLGDEAAAFVQRVCAPAKVAELYGRFLHDIHAKYQPTL